MRWLKLVTAIVVAEFIANRIEDYIESRKPDRWGCVMPDPLTEIIGDVKLFAKGVLDRFLTEDHPVRNPVYWEPHVDTPTTADKPHPYQQGDLGNSWGGAYGVRQPRFPYGANEASKDYPGRAGG